MWAGTEAALARRPFATLDRQRESECLQGRIDLENGLRPELLEKNGALLFIWTLYVLGVMGFLSMILAVRALVTRPSDGA